MPRPKTPEGQQRTNRITLYLTDSEWQAVHEVAAREQRPLTQVFLRALTAWLDRLSEPVPRWQQARSERIMDATSEELVGWVCGRGDAFWTPWSAAMYPDQCPVCGNHELKRTWGGIIQRQQRTSSGNVGLGVRQPPQ